MIPCGMYERMKAGQMNLRIARAITRLIPIIMQDTTSIVIL